MKKLASLVVPLAALALAGCGADSKSCTSEDVALRSVASGCTFAPGTTVTLDVEGCQRCFHSQPSCDGELNAGVIDLDATVQNCEEDRGCPNTACSFNQPIHCQFTTPAVSGPPQQIRVRYLAEGTPPLRETIITVAPGGGTACTL